MPKLKRGGLIFIILLFNVFNFCYSQEDLSLDLEPIVVTKSRVHLLSPYALECATTEDLFPHSPVEALSNLPLDLQS